MAAALAAIRDRAAPQNGTAPGAGPRGPAFRLYALHVNHGIRAAGECAADAEAAASLCASLDIPLAVTAIPPGVVEARAREWGTGLEGAARRFRYGALGEEARRLKARAILTAHTADDLLETILMAFLRGAGPAGLGAMSVIPGSSSRAAGLAPESALRGGCPLVRPLLSLDRPRVLAYLEVRGLSYRTDPSNADERFLRNKIRRRLVPFLDQNFPHWRDPVRRLGETQGMIARFLAEEAEKRLSWEPEPENAPALSVPADAFFSQPEIIREEALFGAIDRIRGSGGEAPLVRGEAGPSRGGPRSPGKEARLPRREALRAFAEGRVKAQDLGAARLERDQTAVRVAPPGERGGGEGGACDRAGFSVLIKRAGVYKLETLTVKAFEPGPAFEDGAAGFFAGYPLALWTRVRRGKVEILAGDRWGKAAVLSPGGGLLWKREKTGAVYFTVSPGQVNG